MELTGQEGRVWKPRLEEGPRSQDGGLEENSPGWGRTCERGVQSEQKGRSRKWGLVSTLKGLLNNRGQVHGHGDKKLWTLDNSRSSWKTPPISGQEKGTCRSNLRNQVIPAH